MQDVNGSCDLAQLAWKLGYNHESNSKLKPPQYFLNGTETHYIFKIVNILFILTDPEDLLGQEGFFFLLGLKCWSEEGQQ